MIVAVIAAQIAAAQAAPAPAPPQRDSATYSSDAVRVLVTEASRLNTRVPASLGRYRASVESEISSGNRAEEREMAVSLEQLSSALTWTRAGEFEQHVIGYRSQSIGPSMASLGFFSSAWTVPSLYGNRLSLLFGYDSTRRRSARQSSRQRTPTVAVHPLSVDRERFYRFTGGDTVQQLLVDRRTIRIVRIGVDVKDEVPGGTFFTGEIDLDLERKHVVRMRGSFVNTRGVPGGRFGLFRLAQFESIAFVELVNAEIEGAYWLPSYQRFDVHVMAPTLSSTTAVFRIVSRFRDYSIDPPDDVAGVAATDTLAGRPHRLTLAPWDSMSQFGDWRDEIGALSAPLSAADFDSVAPPGWRPYGPPVLRVQSERFSDLARFNRVEGAYTGLGLELRLRDAAPGVTARATAGWAWSEKTVRGRATVGWVRGGATHSVRAGRSLDHTNDFRNPFDSGSTIGALFGLDNYDYVDRAFAGVTSTRKFRRDALRARIELGWARDRGAAVHATRSPFGGPDFLANRGVDEGDYVRSALTLHWHPEVSAEFVRPGVGASMTYVRGDGDLSFQRAELSLNARTNSGRWTFASRLDAGVAFGDVPPQQLFELGKEHNLPGYDYKEFAGNQAAVVRGIAMFRSNLLTAPIHLFGRIWLPEPAPALAITLQGGWTGVSNGAARDAIVRLGPRHPMDDGALARYAPASIVTGNARASVSAGIRFFGGTLGFMMARPVDRAASWKFQVEIGQL